MCVDGDVQGSGNKTHKVSNHTAAKRQDDSVSRATVRKHEILNLRFSVAALGHLSWLYNVVQEAAAGSTGGEFIFKGFEVKACDIAVGN